MTKPDDDEMIVVGDPLLRLVSVAPLGGFEVAVAWEPGSRLGTSKVVDLAPAILRYNVYAPLRGDPALFATVHLQSHGFGITWGSDGAMDMGTATIEDLADETMRPEDFDAFLRRHRLTLDGVAAELGISRRMAAYYRGRHKIPRTVALACRYLDLKAVRSFPEPQPDVSSAAIRSTSRT